MVARGPVIFRVAAMQHSCPSRGAYGQYRIGFSTGVNDYGE